MADENAPAAAAMRLKALSRTEKEFAAPLREELPAKLGRFSNVPIGKVIDTENPDFRKMTAGQAAQ
ncbi:hypothetical protein FJZ26_01010, partial [Candidatus Parvarchaeota archaeon]|nr:hypothetical protein [Candidatus Parvarchaeota archaeon]